MARNYTKRKIGKGYIKKSISNRNKVLNKFGHRKAPK